MDNFLGLSKDIPAEQKATPAKCFHPNGTFVEFRNEEVEQSIPDRFEQIVAENPNRSAVKANNTTLSYDVLNKLANRTANAILAVRGEAEESVALFLDHDASMIAALLGALKAGKICVPFDPSQPNKRSSHILEDSQSTLILTNNKNLSAATELASTRAQLLNLDDLDSNQPIENLRLGISPDTLACIIYTSGSTGSPKGVMQSHRTVLHNALRYTNGLRIDANDRVTLLASLGTGQGVPTAFCTLLNGATLCPFNVKEQGATELAAWLIKEEVTVYISASTVFRHFVRTLTGQEQFPKLRLVRLGAEQVRKSDVDLYKKYFSAQCVFGIALSATESGNYSHYFMDKQIDIKGDTVPVGYPSDDMEILLLDDDGKEVGLEEIGEIAVKSRYLSPGYWRNPDLTRATFLADPKGGIEGIYRTGDLGLMRPGGWLEHHGRKGFRVKIRGFGVELGEIEILLSQHPAVRETLIDVKLDGFGDNYIIAYVVANDGQALTATELRKFLRERLPEHMVPSAFVFVEAFPLTPMGKVDRRSLPTPSQAGAESPATFVAPRSLTEKELVRIWVDVLGVEQVGIDDNFFDLGGNSLRLAQVNREVCEAFGKEVSLIEMFSRPTISSLAEYLTENRDKGDVLDRSHYRVETRKALRDRRAHFRRDRRKQYE